MALAGLLLGAALNQIGFGLLGPIIGPMVAGGVLRGISVNALVRNPAVVASGITGSRVRSAYRIIFEDMEGRTRAPGAIRIDGRAVKAGFLDSAIERGIAQGLKTEAIARSLVAEGLHARRQVVLDRIAYRRGIIESSQTVRNIRRDLKPDIDRLPMSRGVLDRQYSFEFEHRMRNPETGLVEPRYSTFSTDEVLTRQEMEDRVSATGEEYADDEGFEHLSTTLVSGRRAGDLGSRSQGIAAGE